MSPSSPRVILGRRSLRGRSTTVSAEVVLSGSGTVRVCGVSVPFASAILPSPYMLFVEAGLPRIAGSRANLL